MKRNLIILISLLVGFQAFSQNIGRANDDYRERTISIIGSLTCENFAPGAELSVGHRFNQRQYIGIGAGVNVFPAYGHISPTSASIFADCQYSIYEKNSTPVLEMKAGYGMSIFASELTGFLIEPGLAWAWCMKSGNGLKLRLSSPVYFPRLAYNNSLVLKVSLGMMF